MLIAAAISYVFVEHGGGLVKDRDDRRPSAIDRAPLPTPPGRRNRRCRSSCSARGRCGVARSRSDIVFLALRRLAAARALLVLLTVTAAVAAAAVTFAEVLRSSLDSNSSEKAYVANGADVQGLIDPVKVVPAELPVSCDEGPGELRQRHALRRHPRRVARRRSPRTSGRDALALGRRSARGARATCDLEGLFARDRGCRAGPARCDLARRQAHRRCTSSRRRPHSPG